jgi:hypothetical protein
MQLMQFPIRQFPISAYSTVLRFTGRPGTRDRISSEWLTGANRKQFPDGRVQATA